MTTLVDEAPERRECLLGGESRRRGIFGAFNWRGMIGAGGYTVFAVIALLITRSAIALVVLIAIPGIVWALSHRVTVAGDSWIQERFDRVVAAVGARSGAARFTPEVAGDGLRVLPREVGRVAFMGVAMSANKPELAVVRHGVDYITTTLEIVGGGDGLRDQVDIDRTGVKFGRLLYAVSRPDVPVDQLDFSTRVVPVESGEYTAWVEEHLNKQASPRLVENLRELAARAENTGEAYRTFMTLSMPLDQLTRAAQLRGPMTPDSLAEAAYVATGQVAQHAERQGFVVRQGLTPARLAALIRHQYAPSYGIDDTSGLSGPRDAFPAYQAHREGMEVTTEQGLTWWHATAVVPRDGWPLRPVGVRWLEALVAEVNPRVIRTITAQHRLQPKSVTRTQAVLANTMDTAELLTQEKRGATSTGEREAQEAGSALVLRDLLYESATGDLPQLRVTISAATREELIGARQQIEAVMGDSDINRVRWYDHRHHHAHLLTAPFGRGIKR